MTVTKAVLQDQVRVLLEACKVGLGYVEATEHSLTTRPNIVTKDADVLRKAIRDVESCK